MPKLTFFPLGNADCSRIDLDDGRRILVDYANVRDPNDVYDKRIDLPATLRDDLEATNSVEFDVVAFTHLDDDHVCGASEFFHLDHAAKYQGEGRIKIKDLWVPACAIFDTECEGAAAIIQAEARYRLKRGSGVRVFSRPAHLERWLQEQGLALGSRAHLITDAGQLVPEFSLAADGLEFFVHSPFASRLADGTLYDRNTDSLVMQATFAVHGVTTRFILGSDVDHEALADIVRITRAKQREERLAWDIFKLPHHCSYLSLGPEKGKEKTVPVDEVKWLFEAQGQPGAIVVSTSAPIPNEDTDQPPHRQAARYHEDTAAARGGRFLVTMEHPRRSAPEPLVITIDQSKATPVLRASGAATVLVSTPAPRAGGFRRPA